MIDFPPVRPSRRPAIVFDFVVATISQTIGYCFYHHRFASSIAGAVVNTLTGGGRHRVDCSANGHEVTLSQSVYAMRLPSESELRTQGIKPDPNRLDLVISVFVTTLSLALDAMTRDFYSSF